VSVTWPDVWRDVAVIDVPLTCVSFGRGFRH
jgi:hypothetical protein